MNIYSITINIAWRQQNGKERMSQKGRKYEGILCENDGERKIFMTPPKGYYKM